MEGSEATTSKVVDSAPDMICKGCEKVLSDSKKLKHIVHSSCKQHYSEKEMDYFRELAAERKKLKDKEHYNRNKASIRAKQEEKLKQRRENKQDLFTLTDTCKSCNKTFPETSILKHITHSKSCLKQYNEEFEDEFSFLRHSADEGKKDIDADNWAMNKASISSKKAEKYSPAKRKEDYEKKKAIRDQLTETCKSCKKNFLDTTIKKHIAQKQSCKDEYTDEQIEFMTGWAKERKRLMEINHREENKEALAVKRSHRNKEKKEKKHEEMIAENIRCSRIRFSGNKITHERNARIENEIKFNVAKNNFYPVFKTFHTYKLSKEDLKTVNTFQKTFQDMFDKFESEIDKVASATKDMEYEYQPELVYTLESRDRNPEKYNNRQSSFSKLQDLWSTLMRPNYQIRDDWHDLCLKIDLTLKEIATRMKKSYEWEDSCFCDECLRVKNIDSKEEAKLRKKMTDRIFASGRCPKLN